MGEVQQTTKCPSCGKRILDGAKACVHCGESFVKKAFETVAHSALEVAEPIAMSYALPTECPLCQCPDIRSVKSVCAEGSWNQKSSGGQASVGYIEGAGPMVSGGPTWSKTAGATQLAQWLAPPSWTPRKEMNPNDAPNGVGVLSGCATFVVTMGIVGAAIDGFNSNEKSGGSGASIGLLLGAVLGVAAFFIGKELSKEHYAKLAQRQNENFRIAKVATERQYSIWERCYYCPKCNGAFDAATGRSSQAQFASESLWA